jgi:riboflavin synthase
VFTGLIESVGKVVRFQQTQDGFNLQIEKPPQWTDIKLGESIAVNGVCLTVSNVSGTLDFFVGSETLQKTTFKNISLNTLLNLERSLKLSDRLGGHMVSGHVDATAVVSLREDRAECLFLEIILPPSCRQWMIKKGSMAIDGVSLTINNCDLRDGRADFYLIPETLTRTNLRFLETGSEVNIECDQIVKIISQQISSYGVLHAHNP